MPTIMHGYKEKCNLKSSVADPVRIRIIPLSTDKTGSSLVKYTSLFHHFSICDAS
jgi:hypothetical protein